MHDDLGPLTTKCPFVASVRKLLKFVQTWDVNESEVDAMCPGQMVLDLRVFSNKTSPVVAAFPPSGNGIGSQGDSSSLASQECVPAAIGYCLTRNSNLLMSLPFTSYAIRRKSWRRCDWTHKFAAKTQYPCRGELESLYCFQRWQSPCSQREVPIKLPRVQIRPHKFAGDSPKEQAWDGARNGQYGRPMGT